MSVFTSLGYVVVRGSLDEWTRFATKTIGAQPAPSAAGELRLRLDEHAYRILIEDGEPAGPRGITVREDEELRARRGVEGSSARSSRSRS
ncbi:hypothetical protein ABZZ80_00785 [Streptomyces sp. NPDC006356]